MIFAKTAMVTTATTTVVWVIVTLATQPEPDGILLSFYRKVRPQVTGWRRIAALAPEIARTNDLGRNLWCWVLGCIMVYSALFGFGKLLLYHWTSGTVLMVLAIVSAWRMSRELNKGFAADA